jgi:hypothetical protein
MTGKIVRCRETWPRSRSKSATAAAGASLADVLPDKETDTVVRYVVEQIAPRQ